jgi:hypothetical protein
MAKLKDPTGLEILSQSLQKQLELNHAGCNGRKVVLNDWFPLKN